MPRTITDINEAVVYLGTDTITSLVLAAHMFDRMPMPGINLDAMWQHSLMVAALARHIAGEQGGDRLTVNTAGVAGLLHDIGQLTLLSNVPERYQSMLQQAGGDEGLLLELEHGEFGVGHAEVGSYVLGLWSLPDAVVEAVAQHHSLPADSGQSAVLVARSVFMAEWLLREFSTTGEDGERNAEDYTIGITPEQLETRKALCEELMQ